jgi:glyoxalase/bleomycin resistance protein/dioxygenase superfamily protein
MTGRMLPAEPPRTLEHKIGKVVQYAYTVPDLDVAMRRYTEVLHVGPWFRRGPFIPDRALYRGGRSAAELSLARAFSGDSMIELIQQHDEAPSVYREVIDVRGFGFHHWAIPTRSFDEDTSRYQAQGFQVAYSDVLDTGARINYLDAVSSIGGMVELVELTPAQLDRYTLFYLSSIGWDGTEPVREG